MGHWAKPRDQDQWASAAGVGPWGPGTKGPRGQVRAWTKGASDQGPSGLVAKKDAEVSGYRWVLKRRNELRPLGVIHSMSKYSVVNLRAQCRRHPRCACWVTPKLRLEQRGTVLKDLAFFFLSKADKLDADGHAELSRQIKTSYGHTPRP